NANVLLHISGYFKKLISADEKQELLEIIENYRMSFIPLIVPITLVKHYVRKYNIAYLQRQHYLNPHPMELMLRNHV
ncbi:MAG: YbgA family protein, partial [Candidatus Brocadia sinica]|nr:YbgA family protein [Candidatus Brocadia sinica]